MGRKMTFAGFVGWYLGSLLASAAILGGLLCLWSWKWHRAHDEEVRERAAYYAEKDAREEAWRLVRASDPVRTGPKARKGPSRAAATPSENEREAARASRCYGHACYYDVRGSVRVPQ